MRGPARRISLWDKAGTRVIKREMLIVPPPAQLLAAKNLLIWKEVIPALRQAVALGQRNREIGAKRVFPSPKIGGVEIEPVKAFTTFDVSLELVLGIDCRRAG